MSISNLDSLKTSIKNMRLPAWGYFDTKGVGVCSVHSIFHGPYWGKENLQKKSYSMANFGARLRQPVIKLIYDAPIKKTRSGGKFIYKKTLSHIKINNFAYNIGISPIFDIVLWIVLQNFNFKKWSEIKKLSKSLIGHILQSFHWIKKNKNPVGRSGAWLSYQGTDQVEIWSTRGAFGLHICNDRIYGSTLLPGLGPFQILVKAHFLQLCGSKLGRMFKIFGAIFEKVFKFWGHLRQNLFTKRVHHAAHAHQPNVSPPSPRGPQSHFWLQLFTLCVRLT